MEWQENKKESISYLRQRPRVVVFIVNSLLAWAVYFFATGVVSPFGSSAGTWFLAAIAYWLLLLIVAPFFTPPKDSLAATISVVLLLAPINFSMVQSFGTLLSITRDLTIGISLIVTFLTLVAIFKSDRKNFIGSVSYQLSKTLGGGEILFTPVVLISALGFYQNNIQWGFLILGFWVLMVVVRPVELIIKIFLYLKSLRSKNIQVPDVVGSILRINDPNVVRILLIDETLEWKPSEVYITHLSNNKKVYVLPLFTQIQNEEIVGTGLLSEMDDETSLQTVVGNVYKYQKEGLATQLVKTISGEENVQEIAGLVVENSTIKNIKFQAVRGLDFEEGMIVFSNIRGKKVYYQILDASTNEESFQQSPYGMHVVLAAQLGSYDPKEGFKKFPWLPEMNQPLFLVPSDEIVEQPLESNEFIIGNIPHTNFGLPVALNDLIEYHAAILGITGTGKTELVFDIIKNSLSRGIKVFCVDFTGEYKPRLDTHGPELIGLSAKQVSELEKSLFAVATGTYGAKEERAALGNFLDEIKPEIKTQIETFLKDDKKHLGIFELSEITNTKATLRTTEMYLSAIMGWARKNRKAQQILIVLEEAHTIIPEVYGSGFDADTQWVVGRIGQIALQGRKYGVGLLLVSQRTALVCKTVLSQCNTYLTHSLVDKTSLDYLSGIYSLEHVKAIPNLRSREFLAQGKAIKSEQPLLVRVDFDPEKLKASKALDVCSEKSQKNTEDTRVEDAQKKNGDEKPKPN